MSAVESPVIVTEPGSLKPQGLTQTATGGKFGAAATVKTTPTKAKPYVKPQNANNLQNNFNPRKIFTEYISKEETDAGIEDGSMFKGVLRINPKNYQECFLDHPKGTNHPDVLVLGQDRNRAMQGDVVAVKIKPKEDWLVNYVEYVKWWAEHKKGDRNSGKTDNNSPNKTEKRCLRNEIQDNGVTSDEVPDSCLITIGAIVHILEKKHFRVAAGKLQLMPNSANPNVLFVATDSRVPRILIPKSDVDKEFFSRPKDFERFLYTAKITDWRAESVYADGRLVKLLGMSGEIDTETERIVYEHQIDHREFSDECLESLPITTAENWKVPDAEFEYRRDFRSDIVFTIDPKTARDLDDALHAKHIDDCDGKGTPGLEIGVHIADVTFFLKEGTELDKWASERGNSTYLSQTVIPMLPRILCEQLCSLNPGVDRLSFSTVFKMSYEAELYDVWFGRSVIRSRVKLAYEHAQDFIENPEKDFTCDELPDISDGNTPFEIKEKTLMLHRIAQVLRQKREDSGALRIELPRLKFALDEDKKPQGVSIYEIKDSNKLVEEFMLLANMEVAKKIAENFPEHALLRNHPPPKEKMIKDVAEQCARIGFPLDGRTSGLLSTSLRKYQGKSRLDMCIRQVISSLTIKPMQQAKYFCTFEMPLSFYHHFALNVDHYTHFTSPIRRYPDVIVHRQLAAALGYNERSERVPEEIQEICTRCNDTKLASKEASDESAMLYFGVFIHQTGPMKCQAVVLGVMDLSFDVLIVEYGVVKRVYVDKMKRDFNKSTEKLTIYWPADPNAESGNREEFSSSIQMCNVVYVILVPYKSIEVSATIVRPSLEQRNILKSTLKDMKETGSTILQ
ncbi:DIS3-like exonuclease 2 [Caenorhabditis elegans]|uniref:DIS3-like exonuclease 2 n=1 Tax=Caenorhabditis elegans TaxID=6239 RepID=DI3L2_CAEEL|nr:DIS3-like exonuclease 2 [Caenorhabditis elegans]Q09568.2 RecName: Full=DIS3-like exonuclease 2 [Caenorhabditis elegans]CCD71518.1 DIS3-like exonuclease 2 [Caenorhabditis elegans]|eukprot:NP_498160.2 DIS3-like exonuclease 2 [Caenorhabditis elegans]